MTKTKPETRQEMAEWLAENFLGWEFCTECEAWVVDLAKHWKKEPLLSDFICSPDGFFAVIEKIREKNPEDPDNMLLNAWIEFLEYQDFGRFYNAVYESWE